MSLRLRILFRVAPGIYVRISPSSRKCSHRRDNSVQEFQKTPVLVYLSSIILTIAIISAFIPDISWLWTIGFVLLSCILFVLSLLTTSIKTYQPLVEGEKYKIENYGIYEFAGEKELVNYFYLTNDNNNTGAEPVLSFHRDELTKTKITPL